MVAVAFSLFDNTMNDIPLRLCNPDTNGKTCGKLQTCKCRIGQGSTGRHHETALSLLKIDDLVDSQKSGTEVDWRGYPRHGRRPIVANMEKGRAMGPFSPIPPSGAIRNDFGTVCPAPFQFR